MMSIVIGNANYGRVEFPLLQKSLWLAQSAATSRDISFNCISTTKWISTSIQGFEFHGVWRSVFSLLLFLLSSSVFRLHGSLCCLFKPIYTYFLCFADHASPQVPCFQNSCRTINSLCITIFYFSKTLSEDTWGCNVDVTWALRRP